MTAFRAAAHAALWSLAVPAAAATDTADAPLVIVNASLVDGTGAPARRTSIHIRDGRILSFGNPAPPETRVLDARGATVLPGLVHVNDHRGVEIALGLGAHALTHLVLDDPQQDRLHGCGRPACTS